MSLTRSLAKSLRWALVPLALAALSIALQQGTLIQALDFIPARARETIFDILHPTTNNRDDAVAAHGSIFGSNSANQSSFEVTPWHPRTIEYNDSVKVATIQEGRLEVVQHPELGTQPLLVKRAALPEYIDSISRETAFYRLLDGLGVTPLFLGHVTESGRITGFLAEYVQPQEEDEKRHGREDGTEACLAALRRMHARGIAHMDAHGGNCLVRGDGSAALIDFELAEETSSGEEFERDLWVMRHSRYVEEQTATCDVEAN
ncbi:hypothetical protein SLS64_013940 [Diaporthe eres]|uniref:Aminoglycoside phosphotransferase domain-containing protein n=1 Tax=Diaporthe eres TaxID=83184 RepID=A0ABR1NPZ0_DIAER